MPRRKVRDEDRQRAPTACVPCKRSKIRCDAQLPCATCVRKDRIASCSYVDSSYPTGFRQKFANTVPPPQLPSATVTVAKRPRLESSMTTATATVTAIQGSPAQSVLPALEAAGAQDFPVDDHLHRVHSIHKQQASLGSTLDGDGLAGLSALDGWDGQQETTAITESLDHGDNSQSDTVKSPEATQSRLILNNKGEKVFIGEIASISFLAFLRHTLRYHMGTSAFTEADSHNLMLEIETAPNVLSVPNHLSQTNRKAMLECYSEVTSGILHLFTHQELNNHKLSPTNISDNSQTAALVALSIGAQCRGEPQDTQYATKIFSNAQASAFEDMLQNPSIEMIKIFLLMTFYMLGACRRNAAFMYLGVAAKGACALGLHSRDYYQGLPASKKHNIESVWKSLLTLDTIVSAVLGRPSSLPEQISDDFELSQPELEPADLALNACYGICARLKWFIQNVPGRQNGNVATTESFLEAIRNWSRNLQPDLRQFSIASTNAERLIGNTHIGCIYYFTVMLATRPFFISRLLALIQKPPHSTLSTPTDQEKVIGLAETCLDAAIHLSQLCHTVFSQGVFRDNMCLIKAFVFAAGLLLGFHLFAVENADNETQIAFDNVQRILHQLSHLSPQAKHYHEILRDFADAIERYRRQKLSKKRRATSQYLDHIFDMSVPQSLVATSQPQHQYLSPVSGVSGSTQTEPHFVQDPMISAAGDSFPDFDLEAIIEMYDPRNLPLIWDDFGTG